MPETVIQSENISKQYNLGEIGTGSIAHDLNRWWNVIRGKDDPYLQIGEENDRTKKGTSNYVWALQDINFEIKKGEAVGIIGRNGAGKSTLLKILSRTTTPTKGQIKLKGKVASLLEVGTGFHPDLSGRENIFLNGAILGMRKQEIKNKFDEIVDFAGVERYIDTPVKRYSSGMYVRLAFAVAAHLEPEILIVDEVLAVGDAEFQKKCIGKMKDVSENEGRTILFVSHDLNSISRLCSKILLLNQGKIEKFGNTEEIVNLYLFNNHKNTLIQQKHGTQEIQVTKLDFINKLGEITDDLVPFEELVIEMHCVSKEKLRNIAFAVCFNNLQNTRVTSLWSPFIGKAFDIEDLNFKVIFSIDSLRLIPGVYQIITYINWGSTTVERVDNYKTITVKGLVSTLETMNPTISQGFYLEKFQVNLKSE